MGAPRLDLLGVDKM